MVIAFASRPLTSTEEKYSVTERETLAVVWGLEHFRKFLWGKKFLVRFDHKPLTKLLTTEGLYKATARIARLSMRLQDFLFEIHYVPGAKNVIADCLSRLSLPLVETDCSSWNDFSVANVLCNINLNNSISEEQLLQADRIDKALTDVKCKVINGWDNSSKRNLQDDLKGFWEVREELSVSDQLLFRGDSHSSNFFERTNYTLIS